MPYTRFDPWSSSGKSAGSRRMGADDAIVLVARSRAGCWECEAS